MSKVQYPAYAFLSFSYKKRGLYVEQIEQWLEYFPMNQIYIVSFDNFIQNQSEVASKIFKFLELPNFQVASYSKTNTGSYNRSVSQNLNQQLTEYFGMYNQRFFEMIGKDYGWL